MAWGWRASRRYRPRGQGKDEIRAHNTVRAAVQASPAHASDDPIAIEPSMRSIPGPTCGAATAWT